MNYSDWYTDLADVFRVTKTKDGNLTRQERIQVLSGIPCRIYRSDAKEITPKLAAADYKQTSKLACDNSVDIQPGDELKISRGGRLGKTAALIRAFAGDPTYYFEPFGAIMPGLTHQEIVLLQEERIQNEQSSKPPETDSAAEKSSG